MNTTIQSNSQDLFKITFFKDSIENVIPFKTYEKTFEEIYTLFDNIKYGEKDGDYISNGEYIGKRNNINASEPRLIPFDADSGLDNTKCPNIEIVKEVLDFLDYKYILHSSFNNSISLPRYRIFFVCDQIVNEKSLKNIYANIVKLLYDNGLYFNPTSESCTLSQGFYLPRYTDEDKKDIFKSYIGGNKYIEFDKFSISSTKITTQYHFIDSEDIMGFDVMPDCIKYLCTNFEEQTGFRNFNTISMVLCSYAINKKMNQDQAIETFSEFIYNYPYSTTLTDENLRLINFKNRFTSMFESDYKFSCGYMKGLKLPGYAFECKKCKLNQTVSLWDYESACYAIENFECSKSESIELINDIYKNKNFEEIESELFNQEIKTKYKIGLGVLKKIESDSNKKDLSHIEICNKYIADKFENKVTIGNEDLIWQYGDSGIYKNISLSKLEINLANSYNYPACNRANDYKSITSLIYKTLLDEEYFDNAKYKLAMKDYTLEYDEKNKKIVQHAHNYNNKLKSKLDFNINKECPTEKDMPLFSAYLNTCFKDDQKQIDLIQEICGSILLGIANRMQKIFILYGNGGNGKSKLLGLLDAAIDDKYKSYSPLHLLSDERYAAQLDNKIANFVGDIDKFKKTDAKLKEIVSSDLKISGRKLYQNIKNFVPAITNIGCCNSLMQITDDSDGFFRRFKFVQFHYSIPTESKDVNYGSKMIANELQQFVNWSIFGAIRLVENDFHLTETEEHNNIMDKWMNKVDSADEFINSHLEESSENIYRTDIYNKYIEFCRNEKMVDDSSTIFYGKMRNKFIEVHPKNIYCFKCKYK